ncbi:hypothetical protein ACHAW5_003197 [Stephanodiscus triporus]|uniref:J domain-containing protein n=1 Tax=Stephanodiscus triporus TaxID=2934178 RepID=A0ABD3MIF6_9STRA
MTLGTIAATAKAGQYALVAHREWTEGRGGSAEDGGTTTTTEDDVVGTSGGGGEGGGGGTMGGGGGGGATASSGAGTGEEGKRENVFARFFDMSVGSKYYEGGFEEKMTRKEAALILGVRESSSTKRIKEAHRKLLILNHPDTGGSTFVAGKINEAKELLLKGKKF